MMRTDKEKIYAAVISMVVDGSIDGVIAWCFYKAAVHGEWSLIVAYSAFWFLWQSDQIVRILSRGRSR